MDLVVGEKYKRSNRSNPRDPNTIHGCYGGIPQKGISYAKGGDVILVFTDPKKSQKGQNYGDFWDGDVFCYTGEGRLGDQEISGGNLELVNHRSTSKKVLLFGGTGGEVTYWGEFELQSDQPYYWKREIDEEKQLRKVIVFRLVPKGKHVSAKNASMLLAKPASASEPNQSNFARREIYNSIRLKMEEVGFKFEKEQRPHFQKRKENELKFTHSKLIEKLEGDGYKVRAKKFYLKPLTDADDCEIGLITGRSSPLYKDSLFKSPNSSDSFDGTPAWTNSDGAFILDQFLESIKEYLKKDTGNNPDYINTYLFTWNPDKWDWCDLKENIRSLNSVGYFEKSWSCGNTKSIRKGDRVFLVRLGRDPKGIMGSGYAKSSYYVAPHWDETETKSANYVDISFDILIDPESSKILDEDSLKSIDQKGIQKWFPQKSGTSIKPELLSLLEEDWFNLIKENKQISSSFVSEQESVNAEKSFKEGRSRDVTQARYERNPQARKVCLANYGFSCRVCNFNFEDTFGDIGREYIHVHHINPISEVGQEYEVDPIKDLIPVCPNCHAMIHSKRPALTIEEVKERRKQAGRG